MPRSGSTRCLASVRDPPRGGGSARAGRTMSAKRSRIGSLSITLYAKCPQSGPRSSTSTCCQKRSCVISNVGLGGRRAGVPATRQQREQGKVRLRIRVGELLGSHHPVAGGQVDRLPRRPAATSSVQRQHVRRIAHDLARAYRRHDSVLINVRDRGAAAQRSQRRQLEPLELRPAHQLPEPALQPGELARIDAGRSDETIRLPPPERL